MRRYHVEPIDVDFAGWSVVEAGDHNAWGIVCDDVLIGHCAMKGPADRICGALNDEQPEHPRMRFLNAVNEGRIL